MPDTEDPLVFWSALSRAAHGLAALAAEIDANAGCARDMTLAELEHFHGLCGALASLAASLKISVVTLADDALGIRPE